MTLSCNSTTRIDDIFCTLALLYCANNRIMTLNCDLSALCDRTVISFRLFTPTLRYILQPRMLQVTQAGHMFALLPRPPARRDLTSRSSKSSSLRHGQQQVDTCFAQLFCCNGAIIAKCCAVTLSKFVDCSASIK